MPGKKLAEIFASVAIGEIPSQNPLDRFWNFSREAAISDRPGNGLMEADGATQAKLVGVHQVSVDL